MWGFSAFLGPQPAPCPSAPPPVFLFQCSIEWFHFACVGLTTKPRGNGEWARIYFDLLPELSRLGASSVRPPPPHLPFAGFGHAAPKNEKEIDKGLDLQHSFSTSPDLASGEWDAWLGRGSGRGGWHMLSSLLPSAPTSGVEVAPRPWSRGPAAANGMCSHSARLFRGKWSCPLSFCLHAEAGAVFLRMVLFSPVVCI